MSTFYPLSQYNPKSKDITISKTSGDAQIIKAADSVLIISFPLNKSGNSTFTATSQGYSSVWTIQYEPV